MIADTRRVPQVPAINHDGCLEMQDGASAEIVPHNIELR
jgi:hypothetical protein